jgi:hypothetical protein
VNAVEIWFGERESSRDLRLIRRFVALFLLVICAVCTRRNIMGYFSCTWIVFRLALCFVPLKTEKSQRREKPKGVHF